MKAPSSFQVLIETPPEFLPTPSTVRGPPRRASEPSTTRPPGRFCRSLHITLLAKKILTNSRASVYGASPLLGGQIDLAPMHLQAACPSFSLIFRRLDASCNRELTLIEPQPT